MQNAISDTSIVAKHRRVLWPNFYENIQVLNKICRFYDKMPKVTKCPSMTKCPKSICPNDILPNHDKMPKLIKCPKDILPMMTICPKSHFAQGDKLPKLSLWQSAIFVTYSPKFS